MGRTLQRYKKLFDLVKKDPPYRLYFLYGPEEFLKREFVTELINARLPAQNRAFNLDILHGDEFDRDIFIDRVSSYPLFTERRIVIVKNVDALSVANQDLAIEWAGRLSDSVILVVEASRAKLDTARLKRLEEVAGDQGLSFCFQHLSDEETIERVKSRLHREGHTAAPDALELLVESVGTHLIDLANEIEKITLSVDAGEAIGREAVAAVVGKYRTENVFGFLDGLGSRDAAPTVARMHRIIDGGEDPVFVLAMMIRRVLQLLHVRFVIDETGTNRGGPAERLGGTASRFQTTILLEQVKRFDRGDLSIYLNNLRWADVRIKSTNVEPRHLLDAALVASSARKTLALYDSSV